MGPSDTFRRTIRSLLGCTSSISKIQWKWQIWIQFWTHCRHLGRHHRREYLHTHPSYLAVKPNLRFQNLARNLVAGPECIQYVSFSRAQYVLCDRLRTLPSGSDCVDLCTSEDRWMRPIGVASIVIVTEDKAKRKAKKKECFIWCMPSLANV